MQLQSHLMHVENQIICEQQMIDLVISNCGTLVGLSFQLM